MVNNMNASISAFATPLPATARPHQACFAKHVTSRRPTATFTMAAANPSDTPNAQPERPSNPPSVWNGVRRVIRLSALSATFLFSPNILPCMARAAWNPASALPSIVRPASAATTAPAQPQTTTNSSDVEAAAMTLGAVTLGGLVMRAIINRSRDDTADRAKLDAECKRLEEEEHDRARRAERKKLETVEASELEGDGELWSELRKRVETIEADEPSSADTASSSSAASDKKNDMRHSPIPDRGTGSALLDRPQSVDGNQEVSSNNNSSGEDETDSENKAQGNPDDMEMLKRMWNMSPPEKE